jgi:hypothetical protein
LPGFTTTDGHRYVSVPVSPEPWEWHRWTDENGVIHYSSGPYLITREPYGKGFVFRLGRDVDGKLVSLDMGAGDLLRGAKSDAVVNARGEHVVNWA